MVKGPSLVKELSLFEIALEVARNSRVGNPNWTDVQAAAKRPNRRRPDPDPASDTHQGALDSWPAKGD
jgi:hypothetical protein